MTPPQVRVVIDDANFVISKTIATIAQEKGGVGKTTMTINTAIRASQKGARVLVLDVDPESNATSFLLEKGIVENGLFNTISDILKCDKKERVQCAKDSIQRTRYEFVDIIGCRGTARKADRLLYGKNFGRLIRDLLIPLLKNYDLILIDQGPSFNSLNVSCYLACDIVILPVTDSKFSIEGIDLTLNDIKEECEEFKMNEPIMKILLNNIDEHTNAGKEALKFIRSEYDELIMSNVLIPKATLYTNSINNNLSIFEVKNSLPKHRTPFELLCNGLFSISKLN